MKDGDIEKFNEENYFTDFIAKREKTWKKRLKGNEKLRK